MKTYAEEQAKAIQQPLSTPAKKQKRKQPTKQVTEVDSSSEHDDYSESDDEPAPAPAKKAKRSSKNANAFDDIRGDGSMKKGLSLFFEESYAGSEGASWHASAAERRIAASGRKLSKLAEGETETRLRP